MRAATICLLCVALIAPSAARAGDGTELLWAGHLEQRGVPVDGTVSASFVLTSEDGSPLVTQDEVSLVVVDGNFVVSLPVPSSGTLTLGVVINGTDLGETTIPLDAWGSAYVAESAAEADFSAIADRVGSIIDPVSNPQLLAGTATIDLANVIDFPAEFLDGDQGIVFSPSESFTFVNGVLGIDEIRAPELSGTLSASDLRSDAVATADLADNTLLRTDLTGTLALAKVAPNTLLASHFSGAANRTQLFEVTRADCNEGLGTLTTVSTCTFVSSTTCQLVIAGNPATGTRNCDGVCNLGNTFQCPNTPAGSLVFK